jgi:DNA polymerase III subunit delta
MQALEFLRDPSSPGVKPVYVVYGDDVYLRHESLAAISRVSLAGEDADMAITRFAGDRASLSDVLDEVRTLPFLSRRRIAIVEEAESFVTAHRKELEAYVEHPSHTASLVFSVKTWPSNTKLAKRVDVVGLALECKTPTEASLPSWLVDLTKSLGAKVDQDTARFLVELVGPEAGLLASEVEKLVVFVGDRKVIRRDDVARMVGAGRVDKIWDALEAATTGQTAKAIHDIDRLLITGEYPVGLLAAMSFSLRRIHHAGMLRRSRMSLDDACRAAGVTWPKQVKAMERQHAHLGPARVARLPEMLLKADLDLKGSSQLPERVVLERLIVELGRPRED